MPRPGCRHPLSSCCWWLRPASCSASGCSRCRRWPGPVGMLCIHAAIIRNCKRFLGEQPSLAATRKWRTRFVLLDLLYGLCLDRDPAPPGRPRRRFQHADDVPDAAGDRGVEHAGGEPADRGAGGNRAGDGGDRAQFRRWAAPSTITRWRCSRSPPKAISRCSPIGCIRRRWRRWKRAQKRTR